MEEYVELFGHKLMEFAPKVVGALLILIAGLWTIKLILKFIDRISKKRQLDVSVAKFLYDMVKWALRIILFIMVISKLGIPTTSFIAMIGAASLAVGMALQGSLANFAGGILIILFKPFKVGDYINAQSISGTVQDITVFTTKISTDTNQMAIIPNGKLSNEKVINYSILPHRREMMDIEIDYNENIKRAKDIILNIATKHPSILKEGQPSPMIMVKELGQNGVILQLRYWTKTGEFWPTRWGVLEEIKETLEIENIKIPYEQQEIHILNMPDKAKA